MKLKATCTLTVNTVGDCPMVAMLRPRSGQAQWMVSDRYELDPWVPTTEYVDSYGNLCQRMVLPRRRDAIDVEVMMEVEDQIAVAPDAPHTPVAALPDDVLLYLLQSRYCPSDKMAEKAPRSWRRRPGPVRRRSKRSAAGSHQPGIPIRRERSHHRCAGHAGPWRRRVPRLCARRHRAVPQPADSGAHGRRLPARARPDGPARLVRGLCRRPLVHLRRDAGEPRGGRIVLAYGRDAADVAFISDYGAQPLQMNEMRVEVTAPDEDTPEAVPVPVPVPEPVPVPAVKTSK